MVLTFDELAKEIAKMTPAEREKPVMVRDYVGQETHYAEDLVSGQIGYTNGYDPTISSC